MRLLWLTSADPSVLEDYLLVGLAHTGHELEVRPWKPSFDQPRDPERHGGHAYTLRLGGELPRVNVRRPEVIVVSRAWRDQPAVERALDEHPGVPVVFFCGEDHYHAPPAWLDARCALLFIGQCPTGLAGGRVVPLPVCARTDLLPPPAPEKPTCVLWGGKLCAGHGDRYQVLGPAIAAGVVDDVVSYAPWATWTRMLSQARFSISIGGIQNAPTAGANVSFFEAGACGAVVLAYPPGIAIVPDPPPGYEFTDAAGLIDLCRAARARELDPRITPVDLRSYIEAHHSHLARARQMVHRLKDLS